MLALLLLQLSGLFKIVLAHSSHKINVSMVHVKWVPVLPIWDPGGGEWLHQKNKNIKLAIIKMASQGCYEDQME